MAARLGKADHRDCGAQRVSLGEFRSEAICMLRKPSIGR
jgi:hypothetical protein